MHTKTNQLLNKMIFASLMIFSVNAWGLGKNTPKPSPSPSPSPSPKPTPSPSPTPTPSPSPAPGNGDFDHIDPTNIVPSIPKQKALAYYAANKSKLKNINFLTVIDYSQKSTAKRFYMIDMRSGEVERFLAAHGKGSDSNHDGWATTFSNTSGSHATSLGYFFTAETYSGDNGYSLRLDGKSSTNSNARSRAIVIHGASYVDPDMNPIGRSFGCPALENGVRTRVINLIAGGSLVFAWHKDFN